MVEGKISLSVRVHWDSRHYGTRHFSRPKSSQSTRPKVRVLRTDDVVTPDVGKR